MIEFKNIKKSFEEKVVLNDVSHIMETGKCNLIIGTSGSGKRSAGQGKPGRRQ
jgi:phospholipid/cholesterol/gamma-HCH transport system ATP-binding protein